MSESQAEQDKREKKLTKIAESREDFVKRLFAVTLSVGIASQISRVVFGPDFYINGHFNLYSVESHFNQILLMLISLAIIVSSWEGYLSAIYELPLKDVGRFYIDIALVFSYLLLTLSIQYPIVWFSILVIIFFEYYFWDVLRDFNPSYVQRHAEWEKKSRSITGVWLVYFSALFVLDANFKNLANEFGFIATSISALWGVVSYRLDKRQRWGWLEKGEAFAFPLVILFTYGFLSSTFRIFFSRLMLSDSPKYIL